MEEEVLFDGSFCSSFGGLIARGASCFLLPSVLLSLRLALGVSTQHEDGMGWDRSILHCIANEQRTMDDG